MSAKNNFMGIGRVGKDPAIRTVPSGTKVAKFSLAIDRQGKDKGTNWFDVQLWGKTAELAGDLIRKGKQIAVQGEIDIEEWEKDGTKHRSIIINARDFQLLGPREEGEDKPKSSSSGGGGFYDDPDEDIPSW